MDVESLKNATVAFVQEHHAWAPLVAGALAFGESLAFLSLFVPATVMLVAIGTMVGAASLDFWPICLGAAAGAALGDSVSYEIGKGFKYKVFRVWPLSRRPDLADRGCNFFSRWGIWSVLIGRFFGPLRAVIPLVAGIFAMPRPIFQAVNITSAVPWAFILLTFGDVLGKASAYVLRYFHL